MPRTYVIALAVAITSFSFFITVVKCNPDIDFFDAACPTASITTKEICANIGGVHETIGKYLSESSIPSLSYGLLGGSPNILTTTKTKFKGTSSPFAFARQRTHPNLLTVTIKVKPAYQYKVELGVAAIDCKKDKDEMEIFIQKKRIRSLNVLATAGCRKAYFVRVNRVKADAWDKIVIALRSVRGHVALATLCVSRPAPLVPFCTASNCLQAYGKVNFAHAYGSFLEKSGSKCAYRKSSSLLQLPDGATIQRAVLRWAGSGQPSTSRTSITIQGETFSTTWASMGAEKPGYWSSVDVTELVKKNGGRGYIVEDVFEQTDPGCRMYSAWSLTVIYHHLLLPQGHVLSCTFLQPRSFEMPCVVPGDGVKEAILHILALDVDQVNNDMLRLNGKYSPRGILGFRPTIGVGMDVLILDAKKHIKGASAIEAKWILDDISFVVGNLYQAL